MAVYTYNPMATTVTDPKAWTPEGLPKAEDTVVFPWGTTMLDNIPFLPEHIVLQGGATVTMPQIADGATVEASNGSTLYVTTPPTQGVLHLMDLQVTGGSHVVAAPSALIDSMQVESGSRVTFQNSLFVQTGADSAFTGGGVVEVYGTLSINGDIVEDYGDVTSELPGTNNGFHLYHYKGDPACYGGDVKVLAQDGTFKKVRDLTEGDVLLGNIVVTWVGRGVLYPHHHARRPSVIDAFVPDQDGNARRVATFTEDHCVMINSQMVPVIELDGTTTPKGQTYVRRELDEAFEFFVFQTNHGEHRLVYLDGHIVSDSYLNVGDGRTEHVETISGQYDDTRRGWDQAVVPLRVA